MEIKLKKAVIKMDNRIKNSIVLACKITIPDTEKSKADVCPIVKTETKIKIRFQSLSR